MFPFPSFRLCTCLLVNGSEKKGNLSLLSTLVLCSHFSLPSGSVLVYLLFFFYPSGSSLPQARSKNGKKRKKEKKSSTPW
jgi:hypothetical protein